MQFVVKLTLYNFQVITPFLKNLKFKDVDETENIQPSHTMLVEHM